MSAITLKALPPLNVPNVTTADSSGEDFSYYQQRVPGAFFYTGTRNEHFKADFPHHHPKFDIDEKGLINAVRIFLLTTFKFMEGDYKNDLNA